jgi:hypothetical protein
MTSARYLPYESLTDLPLMLAEGQQEQFEKD